MSTLNRPFGLFFGRPRLLSARPTEVRLALRGDSRRKRFLHVSLGLGPRETRPPEGGAREHGPKETSSGEEWGRLALGHAMRGVRRDARRARGRLVGADRGRRTHFLLPGLHTAGVRGNYSASLRRPATGRGKNGLPAARARLRLRQTLGRCANTRGDRDAPPRVRDRVRGERRTSSIVS